MVKLTIFDKIFVYLFKKSASKREKLRLLRTNIFGFCRTIANRLGIILNENKVLEDPRDIFFLQEKEIRVRTLK